MGMPRSPLRARRRAEPHNHRPVGGSSDVRRVTGARRVGFAHESAGWIRIHGWRSPDSPAHVGESCAGVRARDPSRRATVPCSRRPGVAAASRMWRRAGRERWPSVGRQQRDSAGSIHTLVTEGMAKRTPRLRPIDRKCVISVPRGRSRNPSVRREIVPSRPVAHSGPVLR